MPPYPLNYHQYVEGLKAGRLPGLKCRDCGTVFTPPNGVCVNCGGRVLSVADLTPRGMIRTFTVIRVGPEGFKAPYVVAMVELEDGPHVLGNLEGVDPDAAGLELIGRPVNVGAHIFPRAENEAGPDGAALTFALAD
jgi:uncharacterized OB-fold protein